MKILIAEDDLVSSKVLSSTLGRLRHEVLIAPNGQEALAMFQAHHPELVISDWMMPEMGGTELCQRIRKLGLDHYTYFILITSKHRHEEFLEAMEAGVDDFLRKPLNSQELAIRLRVAERILRVEKQLILLKNQAEEHALHDQLTGLPNRRLLTDRLAHETARALRLGHKLALVITDIDHFKQINDGYGHKVGDQVIVAVSKSLQKQLRSTDTVCRWGGDELVVLLADIRSVEDVGPICSKLMNAVKREAADAGITAPVSLSMGSAIVPDDTSDPVLLMQQADHALYVAKADGRDRWQPFTGFPEEHDVKAKADLFLRLKSAIAQDRIVPFYQPIIDTATGQVVGAEALARWQDAAAGWVPPDVFIPLAEEKGLIIKLGAQVCTRAFEQLSIWRRGGYQISLALNLSKRQILDADFAPNLIREVNGRGLQPSWVTLEIIERESVINHPLGRQRLKALASAGFRLAIDDFGAGYSSFEMVGAMPFDELKIDMSLIRRICDAKGRRIVRAIVEMGKALDLTLVAEGVESEEVWEILAEVGAQKLQGYFFSKPLPAEAFLNYLASYQPRERTRQAA